MIEFNGIQYELKYTLKRMELIENATGKPFMAAAAINKGFLSISDLKTFFAYGIKEIDKNYVAFSKGQELAEKLIESEGYIPVNKMVVAAIQNDCPFLFQNA